MSNRFLALATAGDFSYCGEPGYCTKCLFRFVRDFITPIGLAHGEPVATFQDGWPQEIIHRRITQERLAAELLDLPISEFVKLKYWEGHLRTAFYALRDVDLQAAVLQRWVESPLEDVRFVDVVIFRFIRHSHLYTPIGDAWIRTAIELAEQTKDWSLVETLVWTLGRSISEHQAFASLARELSQQSPSILKALNETSS